MIDWIIIFICVMLFVWLWTKLGNRINKYESILEGIADDIYDIKKKLGLKAEPRTDNKYYLERKAALASDVQKEIALQQGDVQKAVSFVKNTFSGKINKYMSEEEIMSLAEFAKENVEENQKKIQELVGQGKSYNEICKAFEGEDAYRQGWYNYAGSVCRPTLGVNMPIDATKI
ncbi:MAG: hypothetical protein Q7K71_07335 [Candidatus Omnitrophota bacterium]|nr:hypothetical protein [Candidatus Omnitrophota bacterium]